jgi:hypothetical protein
LKKLACPLPVPIFNEIPPLHHLISKAKGTEDKEAVVIPAKKVSISKPEESRSGQKGAISVPSRGDIGAKRGDIGAP